MPMRKMPVHGWLIVGAVVAASAGCGVEVQDPSAGGEGTEQSFSSVSAAIGSTCTPPPGKVSIVVSRTIGHGQMGKYWIYDWIDIGGTPTCVWFEDQCDSSLLPQNVDTQSNPAYAKASPGNFSCWWNNPDVTCWEHPRINSYVYVRDCYVRPDGSRVDYGCGCW
jgi:hypothetical protein